MRELESTPQSTTEAHQEHTWPESNDPEIEAAGSTNMAVAVEVYLDRRGFAGRSPVELKLDRYIT